MEEKYFRIKADIRKYPGAEERELSTFGAVVSNLQFNAGRLWLERLTQ